MRTLVTRIALLLLAAVAAAQEVGTVDPLIMGLRDRDPEVRNRAFAQLVAHPERDAVVAALVPLLRYQPEDVQWNTAVGLGGDGRARKYAPTPREPEWMLWTEAPRAPAAVIQDAFDLAYEGWNERALAVTILGRLGPDALPALDVLVRALSDHADVRPCAAWALTQLGPQGAKDLVGRRHVSGWIRADILMAYGAETLAVAEILELIRSAAPEQCRLGCRLAAGWRLASDDVRAALARAAERRETGSAVSALLALDAVPDLIALVRGSARPAATAAAAAFVPLLSRPTPLPAPLRKDAVDALCALALGEDIDIDAAHAALRALAPAEIAANVRARLRAAIETWCRSDEEAWRFVGFRHLGVFGHGADAAELVTEGLRDEFDNIAEEAAAAASRVGVPMSAEVCDRLCQTVRGGSRSAAILLRLVAEEPGAAAGLLRAAHARTRSKALDLLRAAAERDDAAVVSIGADWADVALPVDALLAAGPLTPERWRKLDAIGGRSRDRLRVLVGVLRRQAVPAPAALAVLIRAVDVAMPEGSDYGSAHLASVALELLAGSSPADLSPHREVLRQALQHPTLDVRQRAATLLRSLPR